MITYHNYVYIDQHKKRIDELRMYNRPLICTEYMARRNGSLFQTILPMLKARERWRDQLGLCVGQNQQPFSPGIPRYPAGKSRSYGSMIFSGKMETPFSQDEVSKIRAGYRQEISGSPVTYSETVGPIKRG